MKKEKSLNNEELENVVGGTQMRTINDTDVCDSFVFDSGRAFYFKDLFPSIPTDKKCCAHCIYYDCGFKPSGSTTGFCDKDANNK